eukprot:6855563-Pyramimonas_sp.AAC.2
MSPVRVYSRIKGQLYLLFNARIRVERSPFKLPLFRRAVSSTPLPNMNFGTRSKTAGYCRLMSTSAVGWTNCFMNKYGKGLFSTVAFRSRAIEKGGRAALLAGALFSLSSLPWLDRVGTFPRASVGCSAATAVQQTESVVHPSSIRPKQRGPITGVGAATVRSD